MPNTRKRVSVRLRKVINVIKVEDAGETKKKKKRTALRLHTLVKPAANTARNPIT